MPIITAVERFAAARGAGLGGGKRRSIGRFEADCGKFVLDLVAPCREVAAQLLIDTFDLEDAVGAGDVDPQRPQTTGESLVTDSPDTIFQAKKVRPSKRPKLSSAPAAPD